MQSNGRIHILLAGIGLLVVGIVLFLLMTRPDTVGEGNQSNLVVPASNQQQLITTSANNTPVAPTILINTKAGAPFATTNFLNNAAVEQVDGDIFLIAEESSVNGQLYQIYFNRGGSINISLLDENLAFSRLQAEAALRELIPESEMRLCSLVISVTVPGWLSQQIGVDHSGIDYGLSFCPNAQEIF